MSILLVPLWLYPNNTPCMWPQFLLYHFDCVQTTYILARDINSHCTTDFDWRQFLLYHFDQHEFLLNHSVWCQLLFYHFVWSIIVLPLWLCLNNTHACNANSHFTYLWSHPNLCMHNVNSCCVDQFNCIQTTPNPKRMTRQGSDKGGLKELSHSLWKCKSQTQFNPIRGGQKPCVLAANP